jgi:hypothetical protein
MAGRVLGRFWQAAQDSNSGEQILTLCAEVEYIMYVGFRVRELAWHLIDTSLVPLLRNLGSVSQLLVRHFFDLMFPCILIFLNPDRYKAMLHEVAARASGLSSITTI